IRRQGKPPRSCLLCHREIGGGTRERGEGGRGEGERSRRRCATAAAEPEEKVPKPHHAAADDAGRKRKKVPSC
ncbi:unnamed protein product, partial [Urochloa humidicola]